MKKLVYFIILLVGMAHQVSGQELKLKMGTTGQNEIYATNVEVPYGIYTTLADRPIRESDPIVPIPPGAPTVDNVLKYLPGYGVVVRKNGNVYYVANKNAEPISPVYPGNLYYQGFPTEHQVGRIIYNATRKHFYEGISNERWIQIDNETNTFDYRYLTVSPREVYVDYDAGSTVFHVSSNVNDWTVRYFGGVWPSGHHVSSTTGSQNASITYNYSANTSNEIKTHRLLVSTGGGPYSVYDSFRLIQLYQSKFMFSNIIDVYGKEQSGTVPAAFRKKVNPGPERFFAWIASPTKTRMRIKYNNAPPTGGYAFADPTNGGYDYEFSGKPQEWAYEYQLKENRTGADRKIDIEVSFQKQDGTWRPWTNVNLKNSDGTPVIQASITPAFYATKKWSESYAGASQTSKDVGYVYPGGTNSLNVNIPTSKYVAQYGTEVQGITNAHTLVTSYAEAGAGNGAGTWKLPTDADLQNLKAVGFIPNRPFRYQELTGSMTSPIGGGTPNYNNWSHKYITFLDPTVQSENKYGYGNAFYVYDKTGKLVWFPDNGYKLHEYQSPFGHNRNILEQGLHIIGAAYGNPTNTDVTTPGSGMGGVVTCSTPPYTYHEYTTNHLSTRTIIDKSVPQNGVSIYNTIGTVTPLYTKDNKRTTYNGKVRTCTLSSDCGQPHGPVVGPSQHIYCGPWSNTSSTYTTNRTSTFTHRLVHD